MGSLLIDDNGFMFHQLSDERFGIGLIKSPGLAETLYNQMELETGLGNNNDEDNKRTKLMLDMLKQYRLFGSHVEPDI